MSFVIPSLNQASFIENCLNSCLDQQLENFEIVVQDGGSTDGTQEILKNYDSRIRWVSESDNGQSDAINKGIQRARGEIIAWLNSDDTYATKDVLKRVVHFFQGDEGLDIVYGDGVFVDPNFRVLRKFQAHRFDNPKKLFLKFAGSPFAQPAVFFRKSLFEQVGGLKTELHFAMDQELWMRMFSAARKWQYIPDVLANLTLHVDAKSIRDMGKQIRETTEIKFQYLKQNDGNFFEKIQVRMGWLKMQLYRFASQFGMVRMYWILTNRFPRRDGSDLQYQKSTTKNGL